MVSQQPIPRILVVDDNPDLCSLLVEVLRDAGYEAQGRSSAGEALDFARLARPDLVILDLMLGGHSPSFLDARREDPDIQSLPLLIHSGHADAARWGEVLGAPVLCKPVDLPVLLGAVSGALASRSHASESRGVCHLQEPSSPILATTCGVPVTMGTILYPTADAAAAAGLFVCSACRARAAPR